MKEEEVCPTGYMIALLSLQPCDAFFKPAVNGLEGCAFSLRQPLRELGFGAKSAIGGSKPQMFNPGFGAKSAIGDSKPQMFNPGFGAKNAIGDSKPQMFNQPFAQRFFSGTFTPACERLRPMARVTQGPTTYYPPLPAWRKLEV